MTITCPVMRVKSSHPESQGPFVEINVGDFDSEKHERYDEPAEAVLPPPPVSPVP